jgi:hypothetical protein
MKLELGPFLRRGRVELAPFSASEVVAACFGYDGVGPAICTTFSEFHGLECDLPCDSVSPPGWRVNTIPPPGCTSYCTHSISSVDSIYYICLLLGMYVENLQEDKESKIGGIWSNHCA